MKKIYVGIKHNGEREIFLSDKEPTREKYGMVYVASIGHFRTMLGAELMAEYGDLGNPHFQSVDDAEKLASYYRKRGCRNIDDVMKLI